METLQEHLALGMGIAFHAKNIPDKKAIVSEYGESCLLYTSPSPRDRTRSRMPSSA